MDKKTDYRFKFLYAMGIIMVVMGHTNGGGMSFIGNLYPTAAMQLSLFAFASGYFYRTSSEEHVLRYIWRKFRSLIIPFYIYSLVYGILSEIFMNFGFTLGRDLTLYNLFVMPVKTGHWFRMIMGGWFVVPLFFVQVLNISFRKLVALLKLNVSEVIYYILSVIVGLVANTMASMHLAENNWLLVLVRVLYFVPYYGLGIFYKAYLEKYDRKIPTHIYFTVVFVIRLVIIYHYGCIPTYNPAWFADFVNGPIMPLIVAYLGIALWMRIAVLVEPVVGRSKWINLIADNSYSIMINQFLGFMIVKTVFALLSKVYSGFADFDMTAYKEDIWYCYTPKGVWETLIIYVVAGIVVPILIQKGINKFRGMRGE